MGRKATHADGEAAIAMLRSEHKTPTEFDALSGAIEAGLSDLRASLSIHATKRAVVKEGIASILDGTATAETVLDEVAAQTIFEAHQNGEHEPRFGNQPDPTCPECIAPEPTTITETTPEAVVDDQTPAIDVSLDGQNRLAARLRRCSGSTTFGIEAHEAPINDFPVQPSRKDGLGTMCKTHWKEYVSALRVRRLAAGPASKEPTATKAIAKAVARTPKAPAVRKGRPSPTRRAANRKPTGDVAAAKALIAKVDAMPGPEHVKAIATDEVQDALGLVARTNIGGEHVAHREDTEAELQRDADLADAQDARMGL